MSTTESDLRAELATLRSEVAELDQVVKELRQEVSSNKESLGTLSSWIEKLGKFVGQATEK